MCRTTRIMVLICLMIAVLAGAAAAQNELQRFDQKFYQDAGGDSNATIAPGTRITMQNWQNYRKFIRISIA